MNLLYILIYKTSLLQLLPQCHLNGTWDTVMMILMRYRHARLICCTCRLVGYGVLPLSLNSYMSLYTTCICLQFSSHQNELGTLLWNVDVRVSWGVAELCSFFMKCLHSIHTKYILWQGGIRHIHHIHWYNSRILLDLWCHKYYFEVHVCLKLLIYFSTSIF